MNIFENLCKKDLIYFKNCYHFCKGHCCNCNKDEDIILPLLKDEYEYIKDLINLEKLTEISFKLECEKEIKLVFLKCNKKGLCTPHNVRPLVCKLYPYFPRLDDNYNIVGFEFISINDLYANAFTHPCYLIRHKNKEVINQLTKNIKPFLNEPLVIFIFKCLAILKDSLKESLQNQSSTNTKQLIKNNLAKAWKNKNVYEKINKLYLNLKEEYKKDFL